MRLFQEVVDECVSVTNRNKISTKSSDFIYQMLHEWFKFSVHFLWKMIGVKNSVMKGFIGTYLIKNKYSKWKALYYDTGNLASLNYHGIFNQSVTMVLPKTISYNGTVTI